MNVNAIDDDDLSSMNRKALKLGNATNIATFIRFNEAECDSAEMRQNQPAPS